MNEENESLRDALESAYDESETGGSEENTQEPVRTAEAAAEPAAAVKAEKVVVSEDANSQKPEPKVGKAKKQESVWSAKDAPPEPKAEPQAETTKPPQSWKPLPREHWAKLPKEVQDEVLRREHDVNSTLQKSADARKFQEEFNRVVTPFEAFIRAEGSSPLRAVENFMNTAALLRIGSQVQKAQAIASIIGTYGVDVAMLDGILVGQAPQNNPMDGVQQMIAQQLAPVNQFMSSIQQARGQRSERVAHEVDSELSTFAATSEFYEDVRQEMADILEMAANRGQDVTLKDAYDRAVSFHPELKKIVDQRAAAAASKQSNAVVQQKRQAASSVKSSPASSGTAAPTTLRGQIEDAWEQMARG